MTSTRTDSAGSPPHTPVVPQPKPTPLLGNLPDLDAQKGVFGLVDLAAQYGPIYRLTLRGNEMVVVSTQALVDELCDERGSTRCCTDRCSRPGTSPATGCSPHGPTSRTGKRRTASLCRRSGRRRCAACSTGWSTSPSS